MGEQWVRMRRHLAAPPRRVFRAWSDPEELARWFPEQVEGGGLAVGARTTLVWPEQRTWWDVVEAYPERSFVFRWPWLDERLVTTVRVTLTPIGYGTRVDLEDGPFPIDEPGGLEAWAEALEGWAEALAQLRAHLDFSVDLRPRGL